MAPNSEKSDESPYATSLRLFYAVEISEELRDALADLSTRLQKAATFAGINAVWVPPKNFHLTLLFLGNTIHGERLARMLPRTVAGIEPFRLDLRHVGTFPEHSPQPRVLWVDVFRPPPMLERLRSQCADSIQKAGIEVPEGDFKPHITLARFKSSKGARAYMNILKEYKFVRLGTCEVNRLVLMRSVTGGGPARYEPYVTAEFPTATDDE